MNGCAAAALTSAGTVAGITATAISTGADVYHLGKLDSVELARFPEMIAAVHATAADLHLAVTKEKNDGDGNRTLILSDDCDTTLDITIERRTETMCRCRINVGLFGSEPTARLILLRMREHLPLAQEVRLRSSTQPSWPEDPRGAPTDDADEPERQRIRHPK
ncbi:hypothetical protein BH10PLA1_BH10PLA1_18140 [soil metagenome]